MYATAAGLGTTYRLRDGDGALSAPRTCTCARAEAARCQSWCSDGAGWAWLMVGQAEQAAAHVPGPPGGPLRSVEEILEILDASISRGNSGIRKSGEIFTVTANNDDQAEVLP